MKAKELEAMIKTARQLGHDNIDVVIDDSRGGNQSFSKASVRLVMCGDQREQYAVLAIGNE